MANRQITSGSCKENKEILRRGLLIMLSSNLHFVLQLLESDNNKSSQYRYNMVDR